MEGTPPMSSYEDETGVKLIIIIIIITFCDVSSSTNVTQVRHTPPPGQHVPAERLQLEDIPSGK